MNFRLFPVEGNQKWLEQAFLSTHKPKADILVQLEFLADLIHSGEFQVGDSGITAEKHQAGRTCYAVEVFGATFCLEIIDAEPPSDEVMFVKVFAPNPLRK